MSQSGFNGKVVETQPCGVHTTLLQRAQQSPARLQDSSSVNVDVRIIVDSPFRQRVKLPLKKDAWRFMKMTDLVNKLENDLRDAETELTDTGISLQLTYSGAKLQADEKAKKIERLEEIFSDHVSNVVEQPYDLVYKDKRKFEDLIRRDDTKDFYCTYHYSSNSLLVYCERAAEEAVSEKIEGWLKMISGDHEPDVGTGYVKVETISKPLPTEVCSFLRIYSEAKDFLVERLQDIVESVDFVLKEKYVRFAGKAKSLEEADTFWKQIVMQEHSLTDHLILRVMNIEEFVVVFRERIRETKNDVFVTCHSEEGSLLLVGVGHTEAYMTSQINDMLACFGDHFLELDERSFCFLAKNKWDIIMEMTKGKRVEVTPQHNDKIFGLLLMGSKSDNKQVEEAFLEYLRTSYLKIHLSNQQIILLQNPRSKHYFDKKVKSSGFEVEIDFATRSVSLLSRKVLHSEIEKWFNGLFRSGQLQKEDIPEMLNVDELKRIIESTSTVQDMFVLDSEGRWTGMQNVRQDVDHLFQELQSKYAKCEERLVMTKRLNELLNDKDKKFLGEQRQEVERVKWDRILEDKKHLLILAGPKIEVELFKELLLRASEDQNNETVDTQPGASAETQTRDYKKRVEGNDSNGQGSSEEIGDTAEPAENEAWSTKSMGILLKEETINLSSQDTKLKPSEVEQLFRSTTELTEGYNIFSSDSNMMLKVTGTRETIVAVFQEIEAIMKQHKETEILIVLTQVEKDSMSNTISELKKNADDMNINVHLRDRKFVICGPRKVVDECLSYFFDHIKKVSFRQTEHSLFLMKSCEERVSELMFTALNGNKHLKDEIADKFLTGGYVWEMTENQTIVLHAGSFHALRKARFLFREVIQEISFHMSSEPILKMVPLQEIAINIERYFKSRVSIKPDVDAGILHVVCTAEDLENLQLQIKDLRREYGETALTLALPPEKLDLDKLRKDVTAIEPTLLNKFKVFSDAQTITIIAKPDNLDLSRTSVETILLWEARKPEVTSVNPNSAIRLEKEWFELLKRQNVYDWVEEVMQYWGFSVNTDKTVMIFSFKRENLVKGCGDFKSCFRTTHFDTRKTENYTPENIKEMLEAFSLSQLEGKLVVTIEGQQKLKVVSTSDVHEKVQTKLAEITENCSVVADKVEGVTMEDVSVIKRLFPESFQTYVNKNVQFKESKSGNFIIEGQRPDVDSVTREVKDLKSRIVRQEKDCSDIDDFLKERQGKDVVKQVEKAFNCLIRRPNEEDEAVQNCAVNRELSLPEDGPKATEKAPKIIIYARSIEDCQKVFAQLNTDIAETSAGTFRGTKRGAKFVPEKRKEGTVVYPGKKNAIKEEFDSEAYSQLFPKLTLQVSQGIEDSSFWIEAQTSLRELGKLLRDESGNIVIEGRYHDMIRARDYLMYLHSNTLNTQEDHFGVSKPNMDSEIKPPIEVKPAHCEAIQFFLGEKLIRKYCSIEDVRNIKRISFFCNEQNREYVECLKMRVDGIMQEGVDVQKEANQVTEAKAVSVPKDVMKNMGNVFVKYIHSNHSILIFAEDWDSMTKAKRQINNHLGKGKSDRSRRRFKGAESSTSKTGSKARSFIVESGCGIAEGGHINVKVYKANIIELALDAIVNAANGLLHHGGGVARAIAAAAGDQLRLEGNQYVFRHGKIPVTELAVTTAGKLPSRLVFHAVGPEWDNYTDKKECLEDLCCTILRCLCEAENRQLKTIAIPLFYSAIFRVPQEEYAKMYVRALKSFDLTVNQGSLQEVHFVDANQKLIRVITDEMSRNWMSQPDNEDVKRDAAFIKHCLHPDAANISVPNDQLYSQSKNEFKVGEKLTVCIKEGDLLKMEADAIIAWENFTFTGKDKIIQQMLDEGGQSFSKGRQTAKGQIRYPYQVEVGPGGNLKQGHVIFAVVGQSTRITDFQTLLKKIYNRCQSENIRSILIPVFQNFRKVDGKADVAIFIECIMDILAEYSKQRNIDPLKLIIVDHQQHVVDECVKKLKEYSIAKEFDSGKNSNDDCPICLCDITNGEKLKCGHSFCKHCKDEAFKTKKVCPTCKAVCGTISGAMPNGMMTDRVYHDTHLPGYKKYSTIVIVYSFLDGIQKENHPHPGKPYRGARRTAYLPDSPEGREVLELLKVAWQRKLTFTIDRSVTIGDGLDRVTWNEIHHKTKITGGESNHGYPDPSYLTRVKEELAAQGVTMDDLGAAGTSV